MLYEAATVICKSFRFCGSQTIVTLQMNTLVVLCNFTVYMVSLTHRLQSNSVSHTVHVLCTFMQSTMQCQWIYLNMYEFEDQDVQVILYHEIRVIYG